MNFYVGEKVWVKCRYCFAHIVQVNASFAQIYMDARGETLWVGLGDIQHCA